MVGTTWSTGGVGAGGAFETYAVTLALTGSWLPELGNALTMNV